MEMIHCSIPQSIAIVVWKKRAILPIQISICCWQGECSSVVGHKSNFPDRSAWWCYWQDFLKRGFNPPQLHFLKMKTIEAVLHNKDELKEKKIVQSFSHRNDANHWFYSVDVQHKIRILKFSHYQTSEQEMSNLKLGRQGKINSLTWSRRIFSWLSLERP